MTPLPPPGWTPPRSRAPTAKAARRWERQRLRGAQGVPPGAVAWRWGRVFALSEIATMEAPDGSGDVLPTWIVSVSEVGSSCPSDDLMKRVRRDFDMRDAEEDNHEPGRARKLFLVVDPARRVACECKTTEETVERADGYRYTRPKEKP